MQVGEQNLPSEMPILGLERLFDLDHELGVPRVAVAAEQGARGLIVAIFETARDTGSALSADFMPLRYQCCSSVWR
jgi:hypothetical protein